ncbi:MAG: hypothetical protein WBP81_13220 [Solirubrobacteraceae bacterium]
MASQTQFDGHVRKTAGTGAAASEIDKAAFRERHSRTSRGV